MTPDEWTKEIVNLIVDVNPAEIANQIAKGTLYEWCLTYQKQMQMLVIQAPLDYSEEDT